MGGYVALRWRPWPPLTLTGGGRVDHFMLRSRAHGDFAVDAGSHATIATPKANAALMLPSGIKLYASYGQGFHSNDARGVLAASDPVPALVRGTGYEAGMRIKRGSVELTLDRWWLKSGSELVYLGDSGTVAPRGSSRRRGWEATLSAGVTGWLELDAGVATNRARFVGPPGLDRIPNALESAGTLGITAKAERWSAALRIRTIGPRPLVEDGSVREMATTVLNARVVRNLDSRRADADYYYASRLSAVRREQQLGGRQTIYLFTLARDLPAMWGHVGQSAEWELLFDAGLAVRQTSVMSTVPFDIIAATLG